MHRGFFLVKFKLSTLRKNAQIDGDISLCFENDEIIFLRCEASQNLLILLKWNNKPVFHLGLNWNWIYKFLPVPIPGHVGVKEWQPAGRGVCWHLTPYSTLQTRFKNASHSSDWHQSLCWMVCTTHNLHFGSPPRLCNVCAPSLCVRRRKRAKSCRP